MANVFLSKEPKDIETAIMLENAIIHNIDKAVAYTDGDNVFINTDDNLFKILPNYNTDMLKWLLWHERFHKELRHHNRFFRYLSELDKASTKKEFHLDKHEVNIIMDILVHDSLSKMFPELVDTATSNLAQMRNRNSLKYTFKTFTLEEMLTEYKEYKQDDESKGKSKGKPEGLDDEGEKEETSDESEPKSKDKKEEDPKGHASGGDGDTSGAETESEEPETIKDGTPPPDPEPEDEHDKTDWSKLDDIDSNEFIDRDESDHYLRQIQELKRKKFRLGKLTETLNGLATSTRRRTYSMPCSIKVGGGAVLKGNTPGRTKLYLCFDASGSMGCELETFKDIISKSIPQAMNVPCEWFTDQYGKGTFKDIMPVHATSGFNDDGDRTIDLCWKAEQAGYSPIGVTDGGGGISWSEDKLKQLKRTIFVGQNSSWLRKAKEINPKIQTLDI